MSTIEWMMADASTPSGLTNPSAIIAPTASSQWLNTPTNWLGKYMRWTFFGASPTDVCYVKFSLTTAPTVDGTTATVITSNALAASAAEPMLSLPSGVPIDDRLDPNWLFFAYIASATSGKLHVQYKTGAGKVA